ncbi:ABC transporter ATP-binding protein [Armatimonas rosea]|uniref:Oligopeptide/dipeptide ABC transporter ATP-binding protein n=1 Tax=Armatimonas rosea TaxID=685828 RepID=A0A7W9W865_ARMRO|nr:ABC transporter ATP-binding protein [Armatimonas rosea]MBB6052428.1 oligopeptide/dipeptide ABC transporter ATP-binding protein [Armatimonas rosea]
MLTVRDLSVQFALGGGKLVRAVDGVSFSVAKGETLGIVGESGCGKSTTGRALLRLLPITGGTVTFDGQDVQSLRGPELLAFRRRVQMVFQDPYASLSPRLSVGQLVSEPLEIHGIEGDKKARVEALLKSVGLPEGIASRYPHAFSGGQRQRIGIARALALNPELIILDEPVSALDISVRAQVVNLLMDLQQERGIAYIFIGHDLALIRHIAHRVAVMYLGRIVELGTAEAIYTNPRHPYTRSLLASAPLPDPTKRRESAPLEGDPPSPLNIPSGCRFRTRCPFAQPLCAEKDPALDPETGAACHFARELPVWSS